jgi:Fe-S cluster assembly protein SufD
MSTRSVNKTEAAEARWLEIIDAHLKQGSNEPSWLRGHREKARAVLATQGFPTTRDEDWKYTDPTPLANIILQEPQPEVSVPVLTQVESLLFDSKTCCRMVFLDGEYSQEFSCVCDVPPGVVLRSLRDVLQNEPQLVENHLGRAARDEDNVFVALNSALFDDGAFVQIPNESISDKPIQILFVSTGKTLAAQPRIVVVAGGSSATTIVESYVSLHGEPHLTNAVTEIFAGPNARVDHYKAQTENESALHVATLQVLAARDANIASHAFTFGGRVARSDSNAIMQGEGCEVTLNGLYLGRGQQMIDNHTVMDHAMPHCHSYEVYTGILDDESRGVFNGKIFVRPDAQKTDAKQSNRALLLSRGAEINTKPQLEIFADDVKCTHGATIGQLDENALFYLRARGIPEREARDILIGAFAGEILGNVRVEPLRTQIEKELFARLKPAS